LRPATHPTTHKKKEGEIIAPSITNFEGSIIHELAHVAMGQDPFILNSYRMKKNSSFLNHMGLANWGTGYGYNFFHPEDYDPERIAMAASTWQLSPESFSINWISYTDWVNSWIGLFYTPNPYVSMNYGQLSWSSR
jgi:hypothetical protein